MSARFLSDAACRFNKGQAKVLALGGNIHDLFADGQGGWDTLANLLRESWSVPGRIIITYELNGPIRCPSGDQEKLRDAWLQWRTGLDSGDAALARLLDKHDQPNEIARVSEQFNQHPQMAIGKPAVAMELLRQFCYCSRLGLADRRFSDSHRGR